LILAVVSVCFFLPSKSLRPSGEFVFPQNAGTGMMPSRSLRRRLMSTVLGSGGAAAAGSRCLPVCRFLLYRLLVACCPLSCTRVVAVATAVWSAPSAVAVLPSAKVRSRAGLPVFDWERAHRRSQVRVSFTLVRIPHLLCVSSTRSAHIPTCFAYAHFSQICLCPSRQPVPACGFSSHPIVIGCFCARLCAVFVCKFCSCSIVLRARRVVSPVRCPSQFLRLAVPCFQSGEFSPPARSLGLESIPSLGLCFCSAQ